MDGFLQVSETYKRKVLVLGMNGSKGIMEGRAYDSTKLHCAMSLTGEGRIGYTAAVIKFGKSDNFEFYRDKGFQFPALCELELKATSTGMDKNDEEVVGLAYIGPVQAQIISTANPDSPAGQAKKAA